MTNKELIKKAQTECGEYATGYRYDISEDVLKNICEKVWTRAKNLGYSVIEWKEELMKVIGKHQYIFWDMQIADFEHQKINDAKTYVVLGQTRYCN